MYLDLGGHTVSNNGAITASQVTFTGVTISTSAALTCEGASQCEFVDSTLTINGAGGSALSCNGSLNSVISITGGRGTINSLGCVGTLIVADVTNLTTTIDGGTVDIRRSTLHPDEGGIRGWRIHVE